MRRGVVLLTPDFFHVGATNCDSRPVLYGCPLAVWENITWVRAECGSFD